jgi:very-short-patch-repair endonuclease
VTETELAAILKRNPEIVVTQDAAPAARPPIQATTDTDKLSADFARMWDDLDGPPLVTELRFHAERKWRLDFAHPVTKTAIEINGGVWSGGRHVRGAGYLRDREKVNAATLAGWRVFELGTGQVTAQNVERIIRHIQEATK